MFGGLPVYLGAPVRMFRYARRHRADRTGKSKAVVCFVGVAAVLVSWFTAVTFGAWDIDQQILHDRGVTAAGVVTKSWSVQGDSDSSTAWADVRLGDGTTISVEGNPRVGSTAQVTRDPLGRTDPQLGPRPAAPGRQGEKASLAVLIVGHLMTASSVARSLGEALDPRRLRRQRAPADEAPAGKRPSYGLEPHS
ncbi:hypothetical protein [Streptomyces sp. NPDC048277]|uniref:hypothetical protein n=1 Tax=Streptomyces sp. NPDC048277 TaxID=3155027 RepID=UPI0033F1E9E7